MLDSSPLRILIFLLMGGEIGNEDNALHCNGDTDVDDDDDDDDDDNADDDDVDCDDE